jgi:hypothetical protein
MRNTILIFASFVLAMLAAPIFAADPLANFYNGQINIAESQVTALAQAMPADKYNFAPTNGSFKGVRTFAQQVKHVATIIYGVSAPALNEKIPYESGPDVNGPDSIKTKEQILDYLKGAFAMAHKAAGMLTEKNQLERINTAEGPMERLAATTKVTWHTFDHYGQMVVYARMNGVIPGANQPPAGK